MTSLMGGNQAGGGTGTNLFSFQPSPALTSTGNMPTSTTGANVFSTTTNTLNMPQTTGVNAFTSANPSQNMSPYNPQNQTQRINGRCTIRQLTALIPEWKGHFDIANMLLSKQENALANVNAIITTIVELNKNNKKSYQNIKNTLNGVAIQQEKLQQELVSRIKHQDEQNLISIKARRLSEAIHDTEKNEKFSGTSFRVPNHLHVQLSKDLLDRVRVMNIEVKTLQNEVKSLRSIDLAQAVSVVDSILKCHTARISHLGNLLSNTLVKTESALKQGKSELWDTVSGSNKVRKAFLNAVGMVLTPDDNVRSNREDECENVEFVKMQSTHEISRQIDYLRRFNNAFKKFDVSGLDDTHYNIKELLQQPTYTTGAYGNVSGLGTTGSSTGLFGNIGSNQSTIGQTSNTLFGSTTSTTPGLFSSTRPTAATNLYQFNTTGQSAANTSGTSSGLGMNYGSGTTGLNTGTGQSSSLFSQPQTTNIFGSTPQQSATNTLFSPQGTAQTGTSPSLFGQTGTSSTSPLGNMGGTTTNTAGGFGTNTPLASNTWGFGTNTSAGNAPLGSNTATGSTGAFGGGIFGGASNNPQGTPSTTTTATSAFNTRNNNTGGLFGTNSGGFGSTTAIGTTPGFGNIGFNATNTTQAGANTLVGSNSFENKSAAKSTEIVLYQPQKN